MTGTKTAANQSRAKLKRFFKYISRSTAGMVGISVYVLADTFFISLYAGSNGITVLNFVLPLYSLIFAIGSMAGVGSATRYAVKKALGADDLNGYFGHALLWQLILSAPFVALGAATPELWLRLMGGDAAITELGKAYTRIVLLGSPFFMMNYSFTAFARNDGAPTTAMAALLTASAFNIIFDYVFMFPLKMGLAGAALATAMAPVISSAVCCTHFFGKKSSVRPTFEQPSLKKLISCCALGTSAFVGEISSAVTVTVFNFLLLKTAGNIGVAAYGIVANLALVATAIFNGIAQGMQPPISECCGGDKSDDLKLYMKAGLVTVLIIEAAIVTLTWVFADGLAAIFNSEGSAPLAEYAADAIRLYFIGFAAAGINIVMTTYFSATGKALCASAASLTRGLAAIIICALILSALFGINGIWLSFAASELITLAVVTCLLKTQSRRTGTLQ